MYFGNKVEVSTKNTLGNTIVYIMYQALRTAQKSTASKQTDLPGTRPVYWYLRVGRMATRHVSYATCHDVYKINTKTNIETFLLPMCLFAPLLCPSAALMGLASPHGHHIPHCCPGFFLTLHNTHCLELQQPSWLKESRQLWTCKPLL